MIGHHWPNIAWPPEGFAGSNCTQRYDNDLRYYYGAVPACIRLFGTQSTQGITAPATFERLKERGIRDVTVKLHHPYGGTLPAASRFPDIFGGDLDRMMAAGLYTTIIPWGEADIEHPMYSYTDLADMWEEVEGVLLARWPLWVIPNAWAQDKVRTPKCVAAYDRIYRSRKVINWHFYAVTRADCDENAGFGLKWITALYPDPEIQIIVGEWGMLHDKTNPDSPVWTNAEREWWLITFGTRLINHSQVSKSFYFLPDGTPDWAQMRLDTEGKKNVMRVLCDKSRAARLWPRGTQVQAPPPGGDAGVDVEALTAVMHRMWQTRRKVLEARDALNVVLTEVADEGLGQVNDYKRITGAP